MLHAIFHGFGPAPKGVQSEYGGFLEYHEYGFTGSAVRIATGVYVVQAAYFRDSSAGTFIVVAKRDGHLGPLWNIKQVAKKHYALRDEIGRWSYLSRRSYYNGPLNVDKILPLPAARSGNPGSR